MTSTEAPLFDLVLLSAYGRGNWIATQLAASGWKVSLIDVTANLGRSAWEDVEGPFGLLESEDVLANQRKSLADEGELVAVPGGFTMWLEDGPLEFRSELTNFLVRARSLATEAETYVRDAKLGLGESARRGLAKLMYSRNWLAQFAHVFAARGHSENHVAIQNGGEPSPLFSPYSIRRLTADGHSRGLKVAQAAGVTVRNAAKIREIRVGAGGFVEGADIEFDGGSGLERGRAFLTCLSLDETILLGGGLGLYPKGTPKPVWSWERIRFTLEAPLAIRSALPHWFVAIDDVDLAWTRANMYVVKRSPSSDALDVWVKVPTWMREESAAFAAVAGDVGASLSKRLPTAKLAFADLARDSRIVWPVYEANDLETATLKSKNMFFSAPGLWASCDWLGRFRHESAIVVQLEKMKAQWDAVARKAAARQQKSEQKASAQADRSARP